MLTNIFTLEKQVLITFIASFLIWLMAGGVMYLWIYQKKINVRQVLNVFIAVFSSFPRLFPKRPLAPRAFG